MNKEQGFELLQKLCINGSRNTNFAREYIAIEELLISKGINNEILLDYIPPYDKDCNIKMSIEDGKLCLTVKSGDKVASIDRHESLRQLYEQGEALKLFMDSFHLTFAPAPDEDFKKEIFGASQGTIINFNNQLAIVCVESKGSKRVFKRQFEGSLANISLDGFRKSDTYVVDTKNLKDIHYLYGKAYTSLTNTADVRISLDSGMGQYLCTDIEENLSKDSSRPVFVGPLKLFVSKNKEGISTWYDETLHVIDRNLVGVILGWVKNTVAEISTQKWTRQNGFDFFTETDYSPFLANIKKIVMKNDMEALVKEAYSFAEASGGIMSLTFDALVPDKNNNFISTTYVFTSRDSRQQICRLSYADNKIGNKIEAVEAITEKEFMNFCEEKFRENYKSIVSQNIEYVRSFYKDAKLSKNEAIQRAVEEYERKNTSNLLGITENDINRITNSAAELIKALKDTEELPGIKLVDFLSDYPDDYLKE